MRLYADSADTGAVVPLLRDGLVHGVTTNPTILARDGMPAGGLPALYRVLDDAGASEVFLQATGGDLHCLREDALAIGGIGPRVIVKVPATADGFRVAAELVRRETRVLLTAVYTVSQAVFAASINADFIAPYFGRLIDSGEDGLAKVIHMNRALEGTRTHMLVASVRSPNAAATLAINGVRHITADVPVLTAMLLDPVTDASAEEFERVADSLRA